MHTIVLNHEGQLYTWGSTEGGQLGLRANMTEETILQPQLIDKLNAVLKEKKQKVV